MIRKVAFLGHWGSGPCPEGSGILWGEMEFMFQLLFAIFSYNLLSSTVECKTLYSYLFTLVFLDFGSIHSNACQMSIVI